MANICTTHINLHANVGSIDWFEKLIEKFIDEDFIKQFGDPSAENIIDRIGTKWISRQDRYRDGDNTYFLSFESAGYPPDVLIKSMVKQLQEYDQNSYAEGRYWDENFHPIGIYQCNSPDMWEVVEKYIEVDLDNEFYWDEEVEPAFDKLEL